MPRIEAVIFDLDGVLVDSEPAHLAASRRLVAPQEMTDPEYAQFVGASSEAFMAWVRARYGIEASTESVVERFSALVREEVNARPLSPLDGAVELLDALQGRGLPIAVASQSQPEWVADTLAGAGLGGCFEVVVSADAVTHGKPAPDIYLHAAARLGVAPAACLAIEDSVPGVASAAAAGMRVVQTRQAREADGMVKETNPTPSARDRYYVSMALPVQPGAHHVIETLRAFDLGWLD